MCINKTLENCLESVDKPRTLKNQKHKFIDILAIAILATISGADTWDDMEDWGNAKAEWKGLSGMGLCISKVTEGEKTTYTEYRKVSYVSLLILVKKI